MFFCRRDSIPTEARRYSTAKTRDQETSPGKEHSYEECGERGRLKVGITINIYDGLILAVFVVFCNSYRCN